MLFWKALVLFNLGLVLSEPYLRQRYQSQTTAILTLPATGKLKLCTCKGGKCELDLDKSEEACRVFQERFAYWADPSPYFVICEFDPKPCAHSKDGSPQSQILRVTYDAYYLAVSAINDGPEAGGKAALQVYRQTKELYEKDPTDIRTENGIVGLPVEFEGTTTLRVPDFQFFEVCYAGMCRKKMDEFCDSFASQMRKANPDLMKHYLGCTIRHVHLADGAVKMDWAMQFHHRRLIESKVVKSKPDMRKQIDNMIKGIKHEMLKDYRVTGIGFLDYCEITATAQTTEKYHKDMSDPLSQSYLVSSHDYYHKLWKQLDFGLNGTSRSCLRDIVKIHLADSNKDTKLTLDLWVSLGCAKQQGMNNCQEVTKAIAKQWEEGSKHYHNFWTPKYDFRLIHTGASF